MKVLKFGGTSVGSVKSILSLKRIVENEARKQPVVIVVSALGGITDKLLATSQLALKGDDSWKVEFDSMVDRHHKMIDTIITDTKNREDLFNSVDALLEQLRSIYFGVYLIHDLSEKTQDAIVSYGERLSSKIVATLVKGAKWFDSRDFIKTERKNGKHELDSELTNKLVHDTFADLPRISLVPGFISKDENTDEITNLGRGGSDYTAAIIAAALNAEVLEIWTDVDGFMTADPRVIKTAYTINELSYVEAMELCNFGAKVIYPPTIYPVCVKNIPIKVKNTFNPENPGTIIKNSNVDFILNDPTAATTLSRAYVDFQAYFDALPNILTASINNSTLALDFTTSSTAYSYLVYNYSKDIKNNQNVYVNGTSSSKTYIKSSNWVG
jgi:aspartokinase/homoserine dehydrogenase 1